MYASSHSAIPKLVITPGALGTTRAEIAHVLAKELHKEGFTTEVVATKDSLGKLDALQNGKVSFAMVSGVLNLEGYNHIREVTPLYNEALQLLVKSEYADEVGRSLSGLRGHTVVLGNSGSVEALFAEAVLSYAGLVAATLNENNGYHPIYQGQAETKKLLTVSDRSALPDAIFDLSTVPSKVAKEYIIKANYRLVAIPFADAFRLAELYTIGESPEEPMRTTESQTALSINRHYTTDVTIPAFTYSTDPAVPAEPIHTIGAPIMLMSNSSVPAEIVQKVLMSVFETQFARIMQPIVSPDVLDLPPRVKLHEGSVNYRDRDHPFIGKDDIDELSSTLSAMGAMVGGVISLANISAEQTIC